MGKWIDRAVLISLAAAFLYLLFVCAFGSILPAACLSFVCCALLIRTRRGKPGRMTKHQAKMILESWAYGPDASARTHIAALAGCTDAQIVYLPKHPTAVLSVSDIFGAWKAGQDAGKLLLAAPCYADGRARTFARTLRNPQIAILDAARLIPLIRKSDLPPPESPGMRKILGGLSAAMCELPHRRPWYKSLAAGIGLMLVYLIGGNAAYLILSTAMLFLAGISIRAHA